MYTPVAREESSSAINMVNTIDPVYIETAGKIIAEAEKVFDSVNGDILLPLADHIAFAVKREKIIFFFPILLFRILRFFLEKSMPLQWRAEKL